MPAGASFSALTKSFGITDPQGNSVDHGREIDLTEKDEAGDFRHNIIRLIDNTEYKFDTSRYFV